MIDLVPAWLATLTSASTRKPYGERVRTWLGWCAAQGVDPGAATAEDLDRHLAQYAATDLMRRSAIRSFHKYLLAIGVLGFNRLAPPAPDLSCARAGCPGEQYGQGLCRPHWAELGLGPPDERSCRECGHTKPVSEFVGRRRLCKQCRKVERTRKREQRIAAGETKTCSGCGNDVPLSGFPSEGRLCAACRLEQRSSSGTQAGIGASRITSCENPACGARINRYRSHGLGRYCSPACAAEGARRYPQLDCGWCGRPVGRSAENSYCSKRCAGLAGRDPGARIAIECRTCGETFDRFRSQTQRRHCSQRCQLLGTDPTRCEEVLYALLDELLGPDDWIAQHRLFPEQRWIPDAVVPGSRLVVQADGNYWHGKDPRTHADPLIAARVQRDAAFDAYATAAGWTVLRLWEDELLDRPDDCRRRIRARLTAPT